MEQVLENNINLNNKINNNLNSNFNIENEQNKFLESTFGKIINTGIDVGLRMLLPDLIENQVIDIKDAFIKEGLKEGINKAITSAIDFGKSAIGIVTGKFENISQVQTAIKKGGIIDGVSNTIDFVLNKTGSSGKLPNTIINTIKTGKNTLLNNISNNIENEFNKQLESAERLQKYTSNWKYYYNNKDFEGMTKEFYKINAEIKNLIPMENIIKNTRTIQNLHTLIRNKGKSFDLSEDELELVKKLI